MQHDRDLGLIAQALGITRQMSPQHTDGVWLEDLTVQIAPHIREWDVDECYPWADWPERKSYFPNSTRQDVGIDAVAVRRSGDAEYIAIQCKARQLDENGEGNPLDKDEIDSFGHAAADALWAGRWLVTNGSVAVTGNALQTNAMSGNPITLINIVDDLEQQYQVAPEELCAHCEPNPNGEARIQTRTCMQNEAVAQSVRALWEHELSDSGGLPVGQARGKIILPCGTGKTRVSLRIVEQLTGPGELSIVLCPSIALVAQIRREYLLHSRERLRALAVCSDQTAGYDPKKEGVRDTAADPTLDNSNTSASVVKGKVTTDPAEIADWIRAGRDTRRLSVIFGTYQSGRAIADALQDAGATARVLIGDEAHRTAGLRRKKSAKSGLMSQQEVRVRDFTLCHDNDAMPATYRVYQTATPRVYDILSKAKVAHSSDWIVRSMDDESIFGVELYRKSYGEAVKNRWLADYRIVAVGVNGEDDFEVANRLAQETESKGHSPLTTTHFLRGLAFALAMGGATQSEEDGSVSIRSCIGFMNTVDKSRNMAKELEKPFVRDWLQKWLVENTNSRQAARYSLEHLDATSNVAQRENGKRRLAAATDGQPHGILNVGIFGEGTDSPSLSAVAFLEPRRSPIDVIQAVGRAMRTAPDKSMGYIICPIVIPRNADPERWLSSSSPEEGWQELGQILLALRAHDSRIEDELSELLRLRLPKAPQKVHTFIGVARGETKRISYYIHEGAPGKAQEAVENVLKGASAPANDFVPLPTSQNIVLPEPDPIAANDPDAGKVAEEQKAGYTVDPTLIITGKVNADGSLELRTDAVVREKPDSAGNPGKLNVRRTKRKANGMVNKSQGKHLPSLEEQRREREKTRASREAAEQTRLSWLLKEMDEFGEAIRINLLEKSGLTSDRVMRDLNILRAAIEEAAHHLSEDEVRLALNRHFGLDNFKDAQLSKQADGCTIASLLLMNAAMLHQRIANGRWLSGVASLADFKGDTNVVRTLPRMWNRIMQQDFIPVLDPAVKAIEAVEDTGKEEGLARALRHIAAEAERIAETYADMGADHAGPLFNRVMGNQASDGAFFTRPVAASIAARLTLDACGDQDWADPQVWRQFKTVDLACGSGTLLAAMLTDMKRRARERGADNARLADLQKLAVEETIKGLDINPVSLQLAASQLTAGNQEIRYRQMGLHQMPYGPSPDDPDRVSVGTLELLGQKAIVPRDSELDLPDDKIASQQTWRPDDDAELEDAVKAAQDARIVIMNPPFTARTRMGEKFPKKTQQALRIRADYMERILVRNDSSLADFVDKNALEPLFTALADKCAMREDGILTMIYPTAALTAPSVLSKRRILAHRFHIHTVLTCHQPHDFNLSQNTNINESIIVMRRHDGPKPPTRFICLDRMPVDDREGSDFHRCLSDCTEGLMENGWGEVSHWPASKLESGDWTPAVWRSPWLSKEASRFAQHPELQAIVELPGCVARKSSPRLYESFHRATKCSPNGVSVLESKGGDGQKAIEGTPDGYWVAKSGREQKAEHYRQWAAHLMVTAGQDTSTARLTATASVQKHLGTGWLPVSGLSFEESKATAVFINSTPGRLQLMRSPTKKIAFPEYVSQTVDNLKIPDIKNDRIRRTLANCWERTRDMEVPQFRDGECKVRRLWDEAVAEAMGWDPDELARLRHLLHNEPHVRGLGYNQYADEPEE